jgi:uncharacterized glyoxalase superfamily protein PhnB
MPQVMYPCLSYRDPRAAMDWLKNTLGFEEHAVHEGEKGSIAHAEFVLDGQVIMFGSEAEPGSSLLGQPPSGSSIYIVVDDPDARYDRAVAAGADVERELRDEEYGSRGFTLKDPEGNFWSLGTYRPEVSS